MKMQYIKMHMHNCIEYGNSAFALVNVKQPFYHLMPTGAIHLLVSPVAGGTFGGFRSILVKIVRCFLVNPELNATMRSIFLKSFHQFP